MAQAVITEQKTKSVVCYVRVSTADQTVVNQKMALTEYAEKHKLQILNFFEDEAISGTVAPLERKGFKQMMDYIRTNKVDHVLIFDLTRIGRTFWDTLVAIREIERYSVLNAASSKDSFLNLGQESMRQIFVSMLAWFAERERDLLIERIRAGLARAKSQGIQLGRRETPLTDDDMLHIIEELRMPKTAPGQKMVQIAKQFGITHQTLYRRLRRSGYVRGTVQRIDADRVLDLVDAGATQVYIGKSLGVSTEDIAYALHRMNVRGLCIKYDGNKNRRSYCIVKYRPNMTILRYRTYRKLRLPA
jgi:DNA invertase Pin-like site-specific DNA recombinase